ncbi:MAG: precorrin-6Y C5,15-methyltransferase (decarboxylating), CbiT subunit [Firmicutes bacterium]|nr:precorrin-6Y C5,15-methyltransferase (decarboxylating), CbiT subunit [Bacillota bacterium]
MNPEYPGIPDDAFIRGDVPMTKAEVRVLALTKARIKERDIVVDVGAGTGSISIEAALLASQGKVFAIEKETAGIELIKANAARFLTTNVETIHGSALEKLGNLPMADVIFVGGSGGHIRKILEAANQILKPDGRLVVMAVTVETLQEALDVMQSLDGYQVDAAGIQITRLRRVGSKNMFQALNPVYIVACTRRESSDREVSHI